MARAVATANQVDREHPDFTVESVLHAMPDSHIQCRDLQHSWRPHSATFNRKYRAFDIRVRCTRCKTIRVRSINEFGRLLSNSYEYAEGYVIKGLGRMDGDERNVMRLESISRMGVTEIDGEDD